MWVVSGEKTTVEKNTITHTNSTSSKAIVVCKHEWVVFIRFSGKRNEATVPCAFVLPRVSSIRRSHNTFGFHQVRAAYSFHRRNVHEKSESVICLRRHIQFRTQKRAPANLRVTPSQCNYHDARHTSRTHNRINTVGVFSLVFRCSAFSLRWSVGRHNKNTYAPRMKGHSHRSGCTANGAFATACDFALFESHT